MDECKDRKREYNRQYYLKHRDELLPKHQESAEKWRLSHLDRCNLRSKEWYRRNRDKVSSYMKIYYQEHWEECLTVARKWREEHPDYMREWRQRNPGKNRIYKHTYYHKHREQILAQQKQRRE